MLEWLLWFAVACAAIGGIFGSRSAWALLGSLALGLLVNHLGLQFNAVVWAMVDMLVALIIIHGSMRKRDMLIVALFGPIWMFYFADEYVRYTVVTCLMALQLLLTFPISRFWHRAKSTPLPDTTNPFDLMVSQQ